MRAKEKARSFIPFIGILLISSGICFAAEPVAERPVYSEGDSWVFVERNKFRKMEHTFLREEKDRYVFKLGKSDRTTHFYFTSEIKTAVGYPGPIIQFPLTVGKKWNCTYQRKDKTYGPGKDTIRAQHKVEAYEPVTVPAGTFQAFRIRVHFEATGGSRMITMPEKMYFWYSPEVRQLIKRVNARMAGNTWELEKYNIK